MAPESPNHKTGAGVFATTHWSLVLHAQADQSESAQAALEQLCHIYWPPLYAYLRRSGHSGHDSEDFVQGFFQQLLQREVLRKVTPGRGRFRSFLLVSLKNFVLNELRNSRREQRGGNQIRLSLDVPEEERSCQNELSTEATPEAAFDRRWAQTVFRRAHDRLKAETLQKSRGLPFDILEPWLVKEPNPGDYDRVSQLHQLAPGTLAVAVHRLRARLRELVRSEIAETVDGHEEIEDEMRCLVNALAGSSM